MTERRLCGPLDGRRKRRRCEGCQRDHLKPEVYQRQPMQSLYTKRNPVCITSLSHQEPPDSLTEPGFMPNLALSIREQGGAMFSASSLASVIQNETMVKDAVSLIGGLYASQNPHLLAMTRIEKRLLFEQLHTLRETVAGEITDPTQGGVSLATLMSAVLLSFADVLVDPVGHQWEVQVQQVYTFSRQNLIEGSAQSHSHKALARLVRMLNALRAVILEQDLDHGQEQPSLPSPHVSVLSRDGLLEVYASDLEMWAQIQQWTNAWEAGDCDDSVITQANLDARERRGLELTCIGSQFQRDVISRLNWYTTQVRDTFVSFMLVFYHCISIDISRMFTAPAWLRLGCELPIMPHRLSHEQATNALEFAELSISSLHLEAVFYGPILYVLGMEMVRKADRRRIVDFVGKVRHRGFSVIDRFLVAIEQGWAAGV